MAWRCLKCGGRPKWCKPHKVRHCLCNPHESIRDRHWGRNVLVKVASGAVQPMSSREHASQLGRSKGGSMKAARGNTAGNFTSETARKAAKKLWAKRFRMLPRSKTRIMRRQSLAGKKLDRIAIRKLHTHKAWLVDGIQYHPEYEMWVIMGLTGNRRITEQTALRHLGYLQRPRKGIMPVKIVSEVILRNGKFIAVPRDKEKE